MAGLREENIGWRGGTRKRNGSDISEMGTVTEGNQSTISIDAILIPGIRVKEESNTVVTIQ